MARCFICFKGAREKIVPEDESRNARLSALISCSLSFLSFSSAFGSEERTRTCCEIASPLIPEVRNSLRGESECRRCRSKKEEAMQGREQQKRTKSSDKIAETATGRRVATEAL